MKLVKEAKLPSKKLVPQLYLKLLRNIEEIQTKNAADFYAQKPLVKYQTTTLLSI